MIAAATRTIVDWMNNNASGINGPTDSKLLHKTNTHDDTQYAFNRYNNNARAQIRIYYKHKRLIFNKNQMHTDSHAHRRLQFCGYCVHMIDFVWMMKRLFTVCFSHTQTGIVLCIICTQTDSQRKGYTPTILSQTHTHTNAVAVKWL